MKQSLQETRIQGTLMRPLKIYLMEETTGKIDVPYHWQEHVEILWIRKGELSLRIQEETYIGRAGDIFYINPRELHGMQAGTSDCTYLAFLFPLSWFQFAQTDEVEELYLAPLAAGSAQVVTKLPLSTAKQAIPVFQEIYDNYCDNVGNWLTIKSDLLRFYCYLYQYDLIIRQQRDDTAQMRLLLDITRYIQTHCGDKLSLDELGREFHMSPKYFSVFFQKHFSRKFTDYLTAVRIERAKKLLTETDADMEWISQQTGFSSCSYFIRMFRKSIGSTPGQYRAKVLQNLS